MWWMILVGLVLFLGIVLLVRTFRFQSKQIITEASKIDGIQINEASQRLSGAIQFKTLSSIDYEKVDQLPFKSLRDYLEIQFPGVHRVLKKEVLADNCLFYTWQGKQSELKPVLLLAHMDIVPAQDEPGKPWTYPPFGGDIQDGFIWGRGTLDDKGSALGILEAVEYLINHEFQPERTLLIAFGADEEVGGSNGAGRVGAELHKRGIQAEFILDEGGAVVHGLFGDLTVAAVSIAEKGYVTVKVTAEGKGGHSSQPPAHTAIGVLASAIQWIELNPFPLKKGGVIYSMLSYLGPEMSFFNRFMISNLWFFGPLLIRVLSKKPTLNAIMRTTQAVTMISGGNKDNILPSSASALVNCRVLQGETIKQTLDHIQAAINDPSIKIEALPGFYSEPSPISSIESPVFKLLQKTISQVFPKAIVVPNLMAGGTDTKHYVALSDNIYRFLPAALEAEDLGRIHGVNERISKESYESVIRFYIQLMMNTLSAKI